MNNEMEKENNFEEEDKGVTSTPLQLSNIETRIKDTRVVEGWEEAE